MLEIDFERFHNQEYRKKGFTLYVMKNGAGDTLYVGISSRGIWDRWFGWNGHIVWEGKSIYGNSPVGQKIVDHLPDSLKWKIQLWTDEDCVRFCKNALPPNKAFHTANYLEPFIIQRLSPILNEIHNLHPGKDTTSKSEREIMREKELDEVYKRVFEKK